MNTQLLMRAAEALGPLLDDATFVGGATVGLWLTDPGGAGARSTLDVDVVVELATRSELSSFDEQLRGQGFREDRESGVICRWTHGPFDDALILDVMPTNAALLGFANIWQAAGRSHAVAHRLPNGSVIAAIPPAFLIATKLEAFRGRGKDDYLASHDLEDIITIIDGRETIVDDCRQAPREVREFMQRELDQMLANNRFLDSLPGHLRPDAASQARLDLIVVPRLRSLATLPHD